VADAVALNALIEAQVRAMPAQYLWVHQRFKTRPPGEPAVY
jgi:KDO2-lipid IV(A) lauroyltransferase